MTHSEEVEWQARDEAKREAERLEREAEEARQAEESRAMDARIAKFKAEAFQKERRKALIEKMPKAGVPRIYIDRLKQGGLDDREPLRAVRSDFGLILVLGGAVGVGKSLSAAAWIEDRIADPDEWEFDENRRTGEGQWYWRAGKAWRPFHRTIPMWLSAADVGRLKIFDQGAMDEVFKVPELVIDDAGTEPLFESGAGASTFDQIIVARIGNLLPTVITTNSTPKTFRERYGDRVADRIKGHGRFVSTAGPSLRTGRRGGAA